MSKDWDKFNESVCIVQINFCLLINKEKDLLTAMRQSKGDHPHRHYPSYPWLQSKNRRYKNVSSDNNDDNAHVSTQRIKAGRCLAIKGIVAVLFWVGCEWDRGGVAVLFPKRPDGQIWPLTEITTVYQITTNTGTMIHSFYKIRNCWNYQSIKK